MNNLQTMRKKIYISRNGIAKLEKELEYLKKVRRKEIAQLIHSAKEQGDLSENAEYAAAKEEQGHIESRILEIGEMLKRAEIIDAGKQNNDMVHVGSSVLIETDGEQMEYLIVGSNESNPSEGRISNESPIGRAFLGKKVGDVVHVTIPAGSIKYLITQIK